MKRIFTILLALISIFSAICILKPDIAYAVFDWVQSGNNIYYTGGNVGIGTTTPTVSLDVVGNIYSKGTAGGSIAAFNPLNQSAWTDLSWKDNIARIRYGGTGSGATGGFQIQGSSSSVKFTVTDAGKVGIGTAAPAYGLEIAGDKSLKITEDASDYAVFSANNENFDINTKSQYINLIPNHATYGLILRDYTGSSALWSSFRTINAPTDYLHISMNSTSTSEGLMISDNGYVGIGTVTPTKALDITSAGGIRINRSEAFSSTNELLFTDNGQIRSLDDNHRIIFDRTNNVLELREYGSIVLSAGATTGQRTNRMVLSANGDICIGSCN